MMRHLRTVLAVFFAIYSTDASADPTLTLSAPGAENVVTGSSVTVSVHLTGLEPAQELSSLSATVLFPETLFYASAITPGDILPGRPDDPRDFVSFTNAGIADATFLTFGTDAGERIANDGLFYSFDLVARMPGTGQILFDFVSASRFDPQAPDSPIALAPIAGPSLPANVIVPEPSGLILGTVSAALVGIPAAAVGWRRCRSRKCRDLLHGAWLHRAK